MLRVRYLEAAAKVSILLPSPLSEVHQPASRARTPFSSPPPVRLAALCAALRHATPR